MSGENIELETLLAEAFTNPSVIGSFYAEMLSSDLYIITRKSDASGGEQVIEEGAKVDIMTFAMKDGTAFIPVFTSVAELQSSITEESTYMSARGWELFNMIEGIDVVVNPMSETALHLPPEELSRILDYFESGETNPEQQP